MGLHTDAIKKMNLMPSETEREQAGEGKEVDFRELLFGIFGTHLL